MRIRPEITVLAAIVVLVVLGSIAGVAFVLIRGEIAEDGLDGLFLLIVCIVFAASFALLAAQTVREGSLKALMRVEKSKTRMEAPTDHEVAASGTPGSETGDVVDQSAKPAGKV